MKKNYIKPSSVVVTLQGNALMDVWSAGIYSDDTITDPKEIKSRYHNKLWDDEDDDSWL